MPLDTFLIVALTAALGGLVLGLAGFAYALITTAIWVWFLPPALLGPLVVLSSVTGQVTSVRKTGTGFDVPFAWPFIVGGVFGVPVGVALLSGIDTVAFKAVVGLMLVAYAITMLASRRLPVVTAGGRAADAVIGAIGGVMGGLGGLTGPVPTLWCLMRGWARSRQRAVFQTYSLCMQVITIAGYAYTGLITREVLLLALVTIPVTIGAAWVGSLLYARISDAAFRRLVLILLAISGAAMLAASVPVLLAR